MKHTLALSFALAVLTTTGAFASTTPTQAVAASVSSKASDVRVAGAGSKTFDRAVVTSDKKVVVAENRKEFGSQYQRY